MAPCLILGGVVIVLFCSSDSTLPTNKQRKSYRSYPACTYIEETQLFEVVLFGSHLPIFFPQSGNTMIMPPVLLVFLLSLQRLRSAFRAGVGGGGGEETNHATAINHGILLDLDLSLRVM